MSSEPLQPLPPSDSDEKQLCISCLAPNDVSANFCVHCRAPLSSYASTGPFEHLFAEGAVYRQAAQHPRKLIVVLGVWLLFGMLLTSGLGWVIVSLTSNSEHLLEGFITSLFALATAVVSGAMIWKTTRNYFARPREAEPS